MQEKTTRNYFPKSVNVFFSPPAAVEAILFPNECSGTEAMEAYNNGQSNIKEKKVR
jgi:hypothetical protein